MNELILSDNMLHDLYCEIEIEGYEHIDRNEYEDCKWYVTDLIIKELSSGNFYKFTVSKTGSYYSDWTYEYCNKGVRVQPKEVVRVMWEEI